MDVNGAAYGHNLKTRHKIHTGSSTVCLIIPLISSEHFYSTKWGDTKKRSWTHNYQAQQLLLNFEHSSRYQSLAGREGWEIFFLSLHSFPWIKCSQQQHWLSTDWHPIRKGGWSIEILGGRKDLNKLTVLSSVTAVTCQFAVVPETPLSVSLRTY